MANRKIMLPQYGTVMKRGVLYYRTRIKDTNGKLVAIYAKTPEELYNKETLALEQIYKPMQIFWKPEQGQAEYHPS